MARIQHRAVRYLARNVERSLAFYTHLGFRIDSLDLPGSAAASMGDVTLHLHQLPVEERGVISARRMPAPQDRTAIVLDVHDLEAHIESMKKLGFRFRNEIEEGPAGKRMRLEDPDGNPVHLVEHRRALSDALAAEEPLLAKVRAMMAVARDRPLSARYAVPRR